MGVYIKGMEMPFTCLTCDFHKCAAGVGDFCSRTKRRQFRFKNRPDYCPLIEVPEPHGRLIDTSEEITVQMYDDQHEDFYQVKMTIDDLLSQSWIDAKAPTVIPAEEEQ